MSNERHIGMFGTTLDKVRAQYSNSNTESAIIILRGITQYTQEETIRQELNKAKYFISEERNRREAIDSTYGTKYLFSMAQEDKKKREPLMLSISLLSDAQERIHLGWKKESFDLIIEVPKILSEYDEELTQSPK